MKKRIKVFILFLSIYFFTTAQISIPKFEHNFGKIKPDQEAICTFEIENSEEEPIVVEYIEGGWGVYTRLLSGKVAKKGEKIIFEVRYKPCSSEKFEKLILVKINKSPQYITFTIKGEAVE